MKVNIQHLLPARFAQCTKGMRSANLFAHVRGFDASVSKGGIIAILETSDGPNEFKTLFEAFTVEAFRSLRDANPHKRFKAEFFRRSEKSWVPLGYGADVPDGQ